MSRHPTSGARGRSLSERREQSVLSSKANSSRSTMRNLLLSGPSVGRQAVSRTIEAMTRRRG
jgi:hypothetical protein